jgi:hypothetical protein
VNRAAVFGATNPAAFRECRRPREGGFTRSRERDRLETSGEQHAVDRQASHRVRNIDPGDVAGGHERGDALDGTAMANQGLHNQVFY